VIFVILCLPNSAKDHQFLRTDPNSGTNIPFNDKTVKPLYVFTKIYQIRIRYTAKFTVKTENLKIVNLFKMEPFYNQNLTKFDAFFEEPLVQGWIQIGSGGNILDPGTDDSDRDLTILSETPLTIRIESAWRISLERFRRHCLCFNST
jgi:hypothetical protein